MIIFKYLGDVLWVFCEMFFVIFDLLKCELLYGSGGCGLVEVFFIVKVVALSESLYRSNLGSIRSVLCRSLGTLRLDVLILLPNTAEFPVY